ncbi:putative Ankyrin repeat-containing, partial [Fasciolopsis buskii]
LVSNAIDAGDDEVLLAIAQKLKGFADLVGGKEQAACLLPILEKIICCVEEIVVAQAACDALVEIIPKLPQEVVEEKCMGMIRRILEGESRFLGSSQPLDTVK